MPIPGLLQIPDCNYSIEDVTFDDYTNLLSYNAGNKMVELYGDSGGDEVIDVAIVRLILNDPGNTEILTDIYLNISKPKAEEEGGESSSLTELTD